MNRIDVEQHEVEQAGANGKFADEPAPGEQLLATPIEKMLAEFEPNLRSIITDMINVLGVKTKTTNPIHSGQRTLALISWLSNWPAIGGLKQDQARELADTLTWLLRDRESDTEDRAKLVDKMLKAKMVLGAKHSEPLLDAAKRCMESMEAQEKTIKTLRSEISATGAVLSREPGEPLEDAAKRCAEQIRETGTLVKAKRGEALQLATERALERIELGVDGNAAFALLGEDIQSGECEFVELPNDSLGAILNACK